MTIIRYNPSAQPCIFPSQHEKVFYSHMPCKVGQLFVVRFDPRGRFVKHALKEYVHEKDKEDVGEQEEVSNQEAHEFEHPFICSHIMHRVDDDDYIDGDLALNIPNVVMDNPFNDSKGLDTNYDLDESDIELDEAQNQYNLDMYKISFNKVSWFKLSNLTVWDLKSVQFPSNFAKRNGGIIKTN